MKANVRGREIHYDFTQQEVDLLKSLDVWDTLKKRLWTHERITIEGYERIEEHDE
jgi:hypothetical protein